LKNQSLRADLIAQLRAFLDGYTEGFFHQNRLASGNGGTAQRNVELVGRCDDNRFDQRIREHFRGRSISLSGFVDGLHFVNQVFGEVANGIQLRVSGLAARVQMRNLGNRSAAHDANAEKALFFFHRCKAGFSIPTV
jgi:hypothetical protein